jgi:hypothetical protein
MPLGQHWMAIWLAELKFNLDEWLEQRKRRRRQW